MSVTMPNAFQRKSRSATVSISAGLTSSVNAAAISARV